MTKRGIFSGVAWTAASSWSIQLVNLGVFVVLARMMDSAAFGLVAMAGIFIHISEILVDQGLSTAVVQKQELEPEHTDTAFWLSVGFGILLTGIGVLLSGPIARLFREPGLQPVVALLSLNFFLTALTGVQRALLMRRFAFRLLAIRNFGASVVGGVVAVAMALAGHDAMALVALQLATAVAGVALLWAVGGWRPGLRFSRAHAGELLSFGRNIVGIRVLNATSRRSDDLLIGYFLGSTALGYYTIAYKIFKILVEVFTKIVSRVALPAFASVQQDQAKLRAAFCSAVKLSSLISFPMFVGLGVLAPDVVPLLFGPEWLPAVPVMQVLALMGLLQAVHLLINQVLIAAGRPSWTFRFLLGSSLVTVLAFGLVVRWGIVAVAAAYTVVGYALSPVYFVMLRRLLGLRTGEFFRHLRTPALASALMAAAMLAARSLAQGALPPLAAAVAAGCAGGLAYAGVVLRLEPDFLATLRGWAGRG
ncbi:MAG TPA: MOP flippase family protein, partial [Longimicrobium sp.]|nr:MOP flippase family protein [Longimicrobium sp.]